MIAYGIIMWLAAGLTAMMAARIYKGNTNLIHDYHQENVTDKASYGKAFGKAMSILSAAMALSGILGFVQEWVALIVLAVGLIVGIAAIIRVQKRYNGGVFS